MGIMYTDVKKWTEVRYWGFSESNLIFFSKIVIEIQYWAHRKFSTDHIFDSESITKLTEMISSNDFYTLKTDKMKNVLMFFKLFSKS